MRLLFALSATLWAWLVGRVITLGPTTKAMCWYPHLHADTWYRLTPNPYNIPHTYFPFISFVFAGLAFPALFLDNTIIHIITVIRLVSNHAYVPFFVAHVHSTKLLTLWSVINVAAAAGAVYAYSLSGSVLIPVATVATLVSGIINAWFIVMQCHLLLHQSIIRQEQAYEGRQPRLV